jgi:hypothetical protein
LGDFILEFSLLNKASVKEKSEDQKLKKNTSKEKLKKN